MADLLPCPFCGSTNLRYEFAGSQGYIECNECGTEGPCDERAADPYCDDDAACDAWNRRAAAALADEPAVPTVMEIVELADEIEAAGLGQVDLVRAALTRWGNPAPQPVPVSERLPGPEDMTDDGEVWIEDPGHEYSLADAGDYDWDPHKWILRPIGKFDAQNGLRWLPAHALPVPGQEVR